MRFGTFHLSQWHESKSQEQVFQETIEQIKVSEDLGFDSTWLGEHHFSRYGLNSALLTLIAHLAGVTKRLRLGTAVIVLPFYNPITLAEEIATVDLLSDGRLELGIGRGYQWSEFQRFGIPLAESRARFDEALDIMKLAWNEDEFDYRGQFWTFNGVNVLPKPIQKPHPPITVAASSPDGFRNAAARGYNLIAGGSTNTLQAIEQNISLYRETLASAGYSYDSARIKITRPVFVADSQAEARVATEDRFMWFVDTQLKAAMQPLDRETMSPEAYLYQSERAAQKSQISFDFAFNEMGVFGTPEECIRRIEQVDEIVGGLSEMICTFAMGGWDQRQTLRSMERFARDVMPHFQKSGATAEAASAV